MKLESLTIALRESFREPSQSNPYEARLSVGHNGTKMQVTLSPEVCGELLRLCAAEISLAAQIQIDQFVKNALTINEGTLLEHKATPAE